MDLCVVTEVATEQLKAAQKFREAIWDIWPCPSFALLPITPQRLSEKKAMRDPFFDTVLQEGLQLAA